MRPINYQLTNSLVNKIVEFEKINAQFSALDIPSELIKKYDQSNVVQNVFHIAHMVGVNMTLKEIEKFIYKRSSTDLSAAETVLRNYRNLIEYVRSNRKNSYQDLNADFILHLNKLLLFEWKESWEVKYRIDQNINREFDHWVALYDKSIDPLNIEHELRNAIDWYKNNVTRINALIRISITIYRIAQLYPLAHLNQLTIVGITDFLFQKNGYSTDKFLPISKIFDTRLEEYKQMWADAIASPSGNITLWIEKFLDDVCTELKTNYKTFKNELQTLEESNPKPFLNLNKRQLRILRYLQTIPTLKREDYVQMFDVSTMTAFRDLTELVEKKLLKVEGKGRATRYLLANR